MSKLKTMFVALGATALLGAGTMGAAEPQPVKKAPTTNRLFTRSAGKAAAPGTVTIAKAPRTGGYVSVAPAAANANLPVIIGGMLDSGSWGVGLQPYGLYQFPATEGEPFTYIRSDIYPNGGGVAVNDTYFSCEVDLSDGGASIIIRSYDMETWRNTRSFSPSDYSFIATDVAHDPITDQVYGCLWEDSGTGYMFGTIDYVNGVTRKIKSVDNLWNAIAIDADGTIYAIDQEMVPVGNEYDCAKASLYKVNRETGEMTLIGDTGLKPYYASSAVIDPRTGRMFWSLTPKDDSQSALYEVNKATGACTLVYRYPAAEQFAGMYIQAPLAEDGAPAAVEGLAAKFDRGSLSGTLSFKVPTLTYGGSNGSGAISYDIYADGTRISGGTTEWGKQ